MGPGTDRPIPARDPKIDPRVKAGAFGEQVRGPHKPTLDEMGPHASLPVKKASGSLPQKPDLTEADAHRRVRRSGGGEGPQGPSAENRAARALERDRF